MRRLVVFVLLIAVICLTVAPVDSSSAASGSLAWSLKADLSEAVTDPAATALDGYLYRLGGAPGVCQWSSQVERYDGGSWTPRAPMKKARHGFRAVPVKGKIYALGGYNTCWGNHLATVEEYDPASNTWTNLAPLAHQRSGHAAAVVDNKIYLIAGGYADPQGHGLDTIEVYDPATQTSVTLATHAPYMSRASCAAYEGKIYCLFSNEQPPHVRIFDPGTESWSVGPQLPDRRVPGELWTLYDIALVGDLLLVVESAHPTPSDVPVQTSAVHLFNPADNSLKTLPQDQRPPVDAWGWAAASVGNKVYVVGGRHETPVLATVREGVLEPGPKAVGGVVMDPELGALPLEAADSSGSSGGELAGLIAGATAAAVMLGGAAWYARRRRRLR